MGEATREPINPLEGMRPMKLRAFLSTLALLGFALPATAQPYPHRTVSVVVPYPAGGSVDVVARLVAQKLSEGLGAKFTFATSSFGSAGHLAVELLKRDAGVDTLVIPYKGAGPMLNDIMGGQIQLIADPMASSLPLAASGKIKALAVTSLKRVAAAPDIPTIA